MALKDESWQAIKMLFLLFSTLFGLLPFYIAGEIPGFHLTKMTVVFIDLPITLLGVAVYFFYMRLPYPSRYPSTVVEPRVMFRKRSHLKDVFAMMIMGCATGVLVVTCFTLIWG